MSFLLLWRDEVVGDVFDEDSLSLLTVRIQDPANDNKNKNAYLGSFALYPIKDGLKSRVGEPTLLPSLLIVFESRSHTLGTIVESITEWLMDSL